MSEPVDPVDTIPVIDIKLKCVKIETKGKRLDTRVRVHRLEDGSVAYSFIRKTKE